MRFEVAPLPLDVVVCFFLWTGIVPSLWEFVWNVSRNGICLYYYLVYPSLGRLYFTHNSGWHPLTALKLFLFLATCNNLMTLGNATISIDNQSSPQKVSPKSTTVFMTNRKQQRILDSCELYTKRWMRLW